MSTSFGQQPQASFPLQARNPQFPGMLSQPSQFPAMMPPTGFPPAMGGSMLPPPMGAPMGMFPSMAFGPQIRRNLTKES